MIDILFITGIVFLFLLFLGLLYFNTEKFYDAQSNLKKMDNVYFFLLGSGSKDINNKEQWIKNRKRYLLIMAILIICIAISVIIGISDI